MLLNHDAPEGESDCCHVEQAAAGPAGALAKSWLRTYYPLLLVLGYLLAVTGVTQAVTGSWDGMRAMRHFMGGFFLVFSFFKLLDLRGFADAYATYDLLAKRVRAYSFAYPLIELGLGLLLLLGVAPRAVNLAVVVILGFSSLGVLQSLREKREIQCACLGTVFQLPMTSVTLIEDLTMVVMAGASLLGVSG